MGNAETIAHAFGKAKKSGNGWQCTCPCHDDKTASLGVTDGDKGFVVFNCLAGCPWENIQAEAERRGLLSKPNLNGNHNSNAISYKYFDVKGNLVAEKIRKPGKQFTIKRHIQNVNWPLYNQKCLENNKIIYITEGEKDAETLIKRGFPAVTNITGASHWHEDYNRLFKGKTIVICQDNDAAGRGRTDKLLLNLSRIATEIRVFAPDSLKEKEDVTDWVNGGGDPKTILESATIVISNSASAELVNAASYLDSDPPEFTPVVDGLFDIGDKAVIIGKSKTRKSFLTQQLAISIASGRSFLGMPALPAKKVLIVQFEIRAGRYHTRIKKMGESLGVTGIDIGDRLKIFNARGVRNEIQETITEFIKLDKPDVVIVDPLYKLIEGDENKSEDIKKVLSFFDSLTETHNVAVVYVHHDKKGHTGELDATDRGSGSGVLGRDYDAGLLLSAHELSPSALVLEFRSRNHAPKDPISIDWYGYSFIPSSLPAKKQTVQSAKNGPKDKSSDHLEKGKAAVRKAFADGVTELTAGPFGLLLEDFGVRTNDIRAVRDMLVTAGFVTVTGVKAATGQSSKLVTLHPKDDLPVTEEEYVLADDRDEPLF